MLVVKQEPGGLAPLPATSSDAAKGRLSLDRMAPSGVTQNRTHPAIFQAHRLPRAPPAVASSTQFWTAKGNSSSADSSTSRRHFCLAENCQQCDGPESSWVLVLGESDEGSGSPPLKNIHPKLNYSQGLRNLL